MAQAGWQARLELGFERRDARTILTRRRHRGPLAVQRPFHPEPDGTCHVYVLHPPGGLVSGDLLELEIALAAGARALLTTPAATKLYRSGGAPARQQQRFRVAAGARLEWLPQETIAYVGADARLVTSVELEPGAEFIGFEILCLGHPASGESFTRGRVEQRLELVREGQPLAIERARYQGGAAALAAAYGMGGEPVIGTLLCIGPARSDALRAELRAMLEQTAPGESGLSELASALVCRYRGRSVERAQTAFRGAWSLLRRDCFASAAAPPRIWAT
jgi:urease accessory protein